MARKLRVEYEGAIYHVMNRGDRREAIFLDDEDRKHFITTLGEACVKTGWQIHARCLMVNHFHLAVELAPSKIRVNTFAPGPTQVERNLRDDPDYDRSWGRLTPMGRTAFPEEMVGPAVFLAGDDSSYMTGQVFFVDGGWTAQGRIPEVNLERAAKRNT